MFIPPGAGLLHPSSATVAPVWLSQTLQPGTGCPRATSNPSSCSPSPGSYPFKGGGAARGPRSGPEPARPCPRRGLRLPRIQVDKRGDAQAARLLRASPRRRPGPGRAEPGEQPRPTGAGGHGRRAGGLRGRLPPEVPRALPRPALRGAGGPAWLLGVGAVRTSAAWAEQ